MKRGLSLCLDVVEGFIANNSKANSNKGGDDDCLGDVAGKLVGEVVPEIISLYVVNPSGIVQASVYLQMDHHS